VATLRGTFTLDGPSAELVIGPTETLRFIHVPTPPGEEPSAQQVLDRRIFLTRGKVTWQGCRIEDFYWLSVNPEVVVDWEDVTFRVAEDHDSAYAPIELGSSQVTWRGGVVDTRGCKMTLLPHAPWAIADTSAAIEQVRFITAGPVLGPLPVVGVQCAFTFTHCEFESDHPEHLFTLTSHASEKGAIRVRLEEPRFENSEVKAEDRFALNGSTAEIRLIEGGQETLFHDDSAQMHPTPNSTEFAHSRDISTDLQKRIEDPVFSKDEGSLWWPQERLKELTGGIALSNQGGRYSDHDLVHWKELAQEVEEALVAIPQLHLPGSPYHPAQVPFPTPCEGIATAVRHEDGVVELDTTESHLFYDPHGDKENFAEFTVASKIRGRELMDVYPALGGVSIRVTGKNKGTSLDGHAVWRTSVIKTGGHIAAMEAFHPDGASATIVVFQDLPDVILFDVNSNLVRYQAYGKGRGGGGKYNGIRFWNEDPGGIRRTFSRDGDIPLSDPDYGVFVAGLVGEWYKARLTRGFVTAAWHGANHWEDSPPCGCIIRASELDTTWTTWVEYFSYIVQVNSQLGPGNPNIEDATQTSQVLYVEGKGLGCWENIEALDRAWNHPLKLQPLILEPDTSCQVILRDQDGIDRPAEITVLPRWCRDLQTDFELCTGLHNITLLRNIGPNASVSLGTLPVTLTARGDQTWVIQHSGSMVLPKVKVRIPYSGPVESLLINGNRKVPFRREEGFIVTDLAIPPGETTLRIHE
jgi:hypothetical protein